MRVLAACAVIAASTQALELEAQVPGGYPKNLEDVYHQHGWGHLTEGADIIAQREVADWLGMEDASDWFCKQDSAKQAIEDKIDTFATEEWKNNREIKPQDNLFWVQVSLATNTVRGPLCGFEWGRGLVDYVDMAGLVSFQLLPYFTDQSSYSDDEVVKFHRSLEALRRLGFDEKMIQSVENLSPMEEVLLRDHGSPWFIARLLRHHFFWNEDRYPRYRDYLQDFYQKY